jgi:hypothetical protein
MASRDSFELVTGPSSARGSVFNFAPGVLGVIVAIFGIFAFVGGIVLLVISAAVASSVASFNNACSENPLCTPESDPSGGIALAGAVVLTIGILMLVFGVYSYLHRTD